MEVDGVGHGFGAEVEVVRALGQGGVVGHEADEFGKGGGCHKLLVFLMGLVNNRVYYWGFFKLAFKPVPL
ncbi:hypothetical protein DXA68_24235 [Bacteroides stercorirosoris]|uniref:Uncharacterized protein n=1 Tax=Bacteroides stercorirosoris TaxID=871324 RepID=A0A413GHG7_9BACE|nr:hypothetical protein DXA68_24235 [Bacteroides stercorirosoris]